MTEEGTYQSFTPLYREAAAAIAQAKPKCGNSEESARSSLLTVHQQSTILSVYFRVSSALRCAVFCSNEDHSASYSNNS